MCHKKTAAPNHTALQKYKKAGALEKCRSNKCQRRNRGKMSTSGKMKMKTINLWWPCRCHCYAPLRPVDLHCPDAVPCLLPKPSGFFYPAPPGASTGLFDFIFPPPCASTTSRHPPLQHLLLDCFILIFSPCIMLGRWQCNNGGGGATPHNTALTKLRAPCRGR